MRINKALSSAGICSRREADRMIDDGRIVVDGKPAIPGVQVDENSVILLDGRAITLEKQREVILAFNKPKGIVCSTTEKDNIVDFLHYPERIYPMGRLDKDTEGLILLTNNGELMNRLLMSRYDHEKEYHVKVNKPIRIEHVKALQQGVPILDTMTKPCRIKLEGEKAATVILTQGLNRQIRRMFHYFDYRVIDLRRVRIENVVLGNLKVGEYRELTEAERTELKHICKMD